MIDVKKIRDDVAGYKKICVSKGKDIDVYAILAQDDQRKELQQQIDAMKFQQKELAAKKDYEGAKALKGTIQALEDQYEVLVKQLQNELLKMPNTALHPDVPIGKNSEENVVVQTFGQVPTFDFDVQDHITLMKRHDMVDIERGVKLAGARSYFLK